MLPPNELKNKNFSKAVRGYSMVEVDEHIQFIVDKYTELYRENDDLERKLRVTLNKLEIIKKDEESIRSALVNAQRASSAIINEANERAEVVMRATKTNCDKILSDFRADIRAERDRLLKLRTIVAEFKKELFDLYNTHIEYIDKINPEAADIDDLKITEEFFVRHAITDIKKDIAENTDHIAKRENADVQTEFQAELPKKSIPVSGQLTSPPVISNPSIKPDPETRNAKPNETAYQPLSVTEQIKDPVSESEIRVTAAVKEPLPADKFMPAEEFDSDTESDSDDEFDFEYTEEPDDGGEFVSDNPPESETELTAKETAVEIPAPVHENPVLSYLHGKETVPKNTEKKSSVKDTIRELNKIFGSSGNDTERKIKPSAGMDAAENNTEAEDDFGSEEFDQYDPVESVKPPVPDDDDENESDVSESDEEREYREFLKTIENASGANKTDKNNSKPKKNIPKPVKKDGKDFDFI